MTTEAALHERTEKATEAGLLCGLLRSATTECAAEEAAEKAAHAASTAAAHLACEKGACERAEAVHQVRCVVLVECGCEGLRALRLCGVACQTSHKRGKCSSNGALRLLRRRAE